jgi:hypothetical protein
VPKRRRSHPYHDAPTTPDPLEQSAINVLRRNENEILPPPGDADRLEFLVHYTARPHDHGSVDVDDP